MADETIAISSHGTLLKLGDGTESEQFTTVAQLGDINLPELGWEKEECTVQTSPSGARVYAPTVAKDKTITADVYWQPSDATHDDVTGLEGLANNHAVKNWQAVLPDEDETTYEFTAWVESFGPITAPVQGFLKAPLTLSLVGAFARAGS